MATVFDKPLDGFRFAEVLAGDTLQAIAARELGDGARWIDLIAFNALVPPFIAAARAQGVLAYGDQILVPAPAPVISSTIDPDRVFETDIKLTQGRLQLVNGDIELVSGVGNLRQALRRRVETERGELLFHTDYGSLVRRLIGTLNGPTAALLAAEYAKSALLLDPRVANVTSAVAEVVGDAINVRIDLQPVSGRPLDLTLTP